MIFQVAWNGDLSARCSETKLTNLWGALRRRILTPDVSATRLDVRGFHVKSAVAKELLETIGGMFLTGYGYAAQASHPADAEAPLEELPTRFKGFAYEGAAMGFAVRDGLPFGRSDHFDRFMQGRGDAHVYMAYVGLGWAMARLPRFRWPDATRLDPLLRWLVLDGYGFHQAYFHTRRYVHEQYQDPAFPWPNDRHRWYANRAIDQGIGRAMWFVGGTDPTWVATMIDDFPEQRRADLYSGAGLAATYAGGVDEDELRSFWYRAGIHRPLVAQASSFAAEARVRAGLVVPHTRLATEVFCGVSPEQAARISEEVRPDATVEGDLPAYEVWRQRIANQFVSIGRC
jgi:enediyne biosynthesis protein E3